MERVARDNTPQHTQKKSNKNRAQKKTQKQHISYKKHSSYITFSFWYKIIQESFDDTSLSKLPALENRQKRQLPAISYR